MNIPPEILKIRRRHIDKAIEASRAFQAGFITVEECISTFNLAIDWCRFIPQGARGNPGHGIVLLTCATCHFKFETPRWQLEIDVEEEGEEWEPACPSCSGIEDVHGP